MTCLQRTSTTLYERHTTKKSSQSASKCEYFCFGFIDVSTPLHPESTLVTATKIKDVQKEHRSFLLSTDKRMKVIKAFFDKMMRYVGRGRFNKLMLAASLGKIAPCRQLHRSKRRTVCSTTPCAHGLAMLARNLPSDHRPCEGHCSRPRPNYQAPAPTTVPPTVRVPLLWARRWADKTFDRT